MNVYVITSGAHTLAVCANIALARKKLFAHAERRGLETQDVTIHDSDDAWAKSFNCCSEDQRTYMALQRNNEPYWCLYYFHTPGGDVAYRIEEIEMTGDPVMVALAEIKAELARVPKGLPNGWTVNEEPEEEE